MKYFILILSIIFFCLKNKCQNCIPDSPIQLTGTGITSDIIDSTIRAFPNFHCSKTSVEKLKSSIDLCAQKSSSVILEIDSVISALNALSRDLSIYGNKKELSNQLEERKEEIRKSENQLKKNVANIERIGLYITVIKDIGIYPKQDELRDLGWSSLQKKAIEYYNGFEVRRTANISSNSKYSDLIESFVSGDVYIIQSYLDKYNNQKSYYLLMTKVGVKHNNDNNLSNTNTTTLSRPVKTYNLLETNDYYNQLISEGISRHEIENVAKIVTNQLEEIVKYNDDAEQKINLMIRSTQNEISLIEAKIKDIKKKISDSDEKVKAICNKIDVKFYVKDIKQSIHLAEEKIKQLILVKTSNRVIEKEKEVIMVEPTRINTSNDPIKQISARILEIYTELNKTYSEFNRVIHHSRIENGEYNAESSVYSNQEILTRKVNRIWVYLILGDGQYYDIYVFAQFKVLEHSTGYKRDRLPKIFEKPSMPTNEIELSNVKTKKKPQLGKYLENGIQNVGVVMSNLVENSETIAACYQLSTAFNYFSIGVNHRLYSRQEYAGWNLSLGYYWKHQGKFKSGLLFRNSFELTTDKSIHLGFDTSIGFGNISFASIQPKVGLHFSVCSLDLGLQFDTYRGATLGFQIGLYLDKNFGT